MLCIRACVGIKWLGAKIEILRGRGAGGGALRAPCESELFFDCYARLCFTAINYVAARDNRLLRIYALCREREEEINQS